VNTLYTYGYTGGSIEDLKRYADAGALILDIRHKPYSRWQPQWNRRSLEEALWMDYAHCGNLGNRNYKGDLDDPGVHLIVNLEAGLELLRELLRKRPVVLLCACKNAEGCHRNTVARAAVQQFRGVQVRHLAPGDSLEYQQPTLPAVDPDEWNAVREDTDAR
jgi:uncharacterized protein (DUF488 family)